MGRLTFTDFMSIYNMMKSDREEWIKIAAMQPSSSSQPDQQAEEEDEENIEIQADFLFLNEHDRLTATGQEEEEEEEEEEESRNGEAVTSSRVPEILKSYPADRTEGMKNRARIELEAIPRPLSSHWLIKERSLKAGIAGLRFFQDPDLNTLLIQVLERKDCLDSPTRAVRAVARIFWADEEIVSMHLTRGYSSSNVPTHRLSGPVDRDPLPYSNDVHDLFMILHQINDVDHWITSGKHLWLYNTLYSFRQGLQRQNETRRAAEAAAKRLRVRRSGSVSSGGDGGGGGSGDQAGILIAPGIENRKRFRTDDDNSVSSTGTE